MAKKKSPGLKLFGQFNGLSADEQAVFARACLGDSKNVFADELYWAEQRVIYAEMSGASKAEFARQELLPKVERAESFDRLGKKPAARRDARIRELGEKYTAQEIYDNYRDELNSLYPGGKPVTVYTIAGVLQRGNNSR